MKKSFLTVLTFTLASTFAHADIMGGELRDQLTASLGPSVVQQVIKDSNTKGSPLRKIIAANDVSDGRNSEGTFNVPTLPADIQLTLVSGDDQFGTYCEPIENSDKYSCSNGQSATVLVTIAGEQGVHKAAVLTTINVIYSVNKTNSWIQDDAGNSTNSKTEVSVKFEKQVKLAP